MNEGREIRFIDLFSGIGGFRLGLQRASGVKSTMGNGHSPHSGGRDVSHPLSDSTFRCVWSCDNNKYANQIYFRRFKPKRGEHHTGNIRRFAAKNVPDHDLLCAGFPCQAFSIAGKRKGFGDTRGTLFHEIARIARVKRPPLLLLENVKGLLSHDKGQTFGTILEVLGGIGYRLEWQVLNSKWFGVPQNRERVFIIGHLGDGGGGQIFPVKEIGRFSVSTQEETRGEGTWVRDERDSVSRSLRVGGSGLEENLVAQTISARYYKDGSENLIYVGGIGEKDWANDGKNYSRNYPQGQRVYSTEGVSSTLAGNAGGLGGKTGLYAIPVLTPNRERKRQHGRRFKEVGDPSFTLTGQDIHGVAIATGVNMPSRGPEPRKDGLASTIKVSHPNPIIDGFRIRRLTPVECERLQSFPDKFTEGISDSQRYRALGNAVTVNVIEFLGRRIKQIFMEAGEC